ncbi:LexA family transcriptional regulator [Acetobacter sacchari]|uniref:LexA family transcriptional regulator n=1 Tax=Acetobacter sacchari TaxID=2661687 RepID=A0ABS3M1L0_9PROT|nr:S24 family peptidase [Acetobacter sacchari]MBO1362087.1 LexA family transcriptional regulator [Acetobacter sacchari]
MKTDEERLRDSQRAWIDEIVEKHGETYTSIARKAKLTPTTLTRFMNKEADANHNLSAKTEAKIRAVFSDVAIKRPELIRVSNLSHVPIVGVVQAGLWQSDFVLSEYTAAEFIEVTPDPRYPHFQRVAFRVQGDSMNLVYVPGTVVLAIRFYDLGRNPRTGEKVIAVRQSNGVEEATVKEIEIMPDGRVALWPRSTNPEYSQAIIVPDMSALAPFADDGGHPEVRIEALIVQSIRLE